MEKSKIVTIWDEVALVPDHNLGALADRLEALASGAPSQTCIQNQLCPDQDCIVLISASACSVK